MRRVSFPSFSLAGGRRVLAATVAMGSLLLGGLPARAEGPLERIARTGELVLTGYADLPPLLSPGAKGQLAGYAVVVADRVAAELSTALGRPVKLRIVPATDPVALKREIASGKADLACGFPFSWERDMVVDHSLPIGISGLRLLTQAGGIDGSVASLAGRPIGVVRGSLAEGELLGMQPRAQAVPFNNLPAAMAALGSGAVQGVMGDSMVLAGMAASKGIRGAILVPELPYEVYGVSCLVPPDSSKYRHLVNLAIARLLQGYLDGEPQAVAAVNRWLGPDSSIGIPQPRLEAIFGVILVGAEAIRPLPAAGSPAAPPAAASPSR
jgi:polar amino acid transport system substrate-binding protein